MLPQLHDRLWLGRQVPLSTSHFCIGWVGSADVIVAAFDLGINFFFVTADLHWPKYEESRRGLAQLLARGPAVRSQLVVGVVSYVTQPEFCWAPFMELEQTISGLDYIDVAIAGGVYGHEFGQRLPQYVAQLQRKHVGVRSIGATFHDRIAARNCIVEEAVDIAFIRYNPSHTGVQEDVFPFVPRKRSTRVFNFKTLSNVVAARRCDQLGIPSDRWRPQPSDYYRFVLSRPEIDGVLCGLETVDQLRQIQSAMEKGPLSSEEAQYLVDLGALNEGRATAYRRDSSSLVQS